MKKTRRIYASREVHARGLQEEWARERRGQAVGAFVVFLIVLGAFVGAGTIDFSTL